MSSIRKIEKHVVRILQLSLIFVLACPRLSAQESVSSEAVVDQLQKQTFNYFLHEVNPEKGLVRDWAWNREGYSTAPASIAAVGFGLTAYGVGVERGWMDREDAVARTRKTLRFFRYEAPHQNGFFYHFLSMERGIRFKGSEVSPIDTALFLAGCLFTAEYFQDEEIRRLSREIYNRVDWPWMLNGGKTFSHAWSPERRFFKERWSNYDESVLLYLLALGSATHPIPEESWKAIRRPLGSYGSHRLVQSSPLFTHQYPHIWIDFRYKNDGLMDYFENSRQAALAHRQFAMDQSPHFKSYGPDSWGFTAGEGPSGYKAYRAPPGKAEHDGTIVPTGCLASIVFTPKESLSCLKFLRENYAAQLWGRYGPSDAFNRDQNWFSKKVFAINQGPVLLMIENYRTGLIWRVMGQSQVVRRALRRAGFQEGTIPLKWPDPPVVRAPLARKRIDIDGNLNDWPTVRPLIQLDSSFIEWGEVAGPDDLHGKISFAWDEDFLYFAAEVRDDSAVFSRANDQIWRDDILEIFIDPQGNSLYWENRSDFQVGFSIHPPRQTVRTWSWFQGGEDPTLTEGVKVKARHDAGGYVLEGAIRWSFLKMEPKIGNEVRLSPALHDKDEDGSEAKLIWFFRNEEEADRYVLGRLLLT